MVSVLLENDNIKIKAPLGVTMREIASKSGASMEFGCRVGDCSTCVATVKAGGSLLSPMSEKESGVLEMLGFAIVNQRLMCQCSISAQEGEIIISYDL